MRFSTTVALVERVNSIQVRVTDSSNRTTTETRKVTKTEVVEPPMTCDANGDETIDIDDINLIVAARNQPATSADETQRGMTRVAVFGRVSMGPR